jgi:Tfp pilus assembly protein PilE
MIEVVIILGLLAWAAYWTWANVIKESPTAKATRILLSANIAFKNKNIRSLEFLRGAITPPRNHAQVTTRNFIDIYIKTLKNEPN